MVLGIVGVCPMREAEVLGKEREQGRPNGLLPCGMHESRGLSLVFALLTSQALPRYRVLMLLIHIHC